ncbi:AMP-binding protein [Methanobrevibacter curvatus]|uniref:Acetyl-coenzyme A synthetase n=1 Tax=Methanobrevibacter curvatus TaxID=49547 RepID=A0A162FF99_9EURY|nr:AMP-binding protein [Methanobrevibacter curvatus]KZX12235.1 acetyl-coenzyme A synthetase [Methanobrevibacter curvatus]
MSSLLKEFVNRIEFESYEDFRDNFQFKVPENFNFAYDVVDKYADKNPEKLAFIWCNDHGEEHKFTFKDVKKYSNKTANFLVNLGIKKGDTVLLTLKNRYEFWFIIIALHKIGAIPVPATHMLKSHDIVYRLNESEAKMVISIDENEELINEFEKGFNEINRDILKVSVGTKRPEGWIDYKKEFLNESEVFERKNAEQTKNHDVMILYFSSGTSGEPKMVIHDYTYPLAHIITSKYWHNAVENGIHHTSADTGWMKAVWGGLYGQWIVGTGVFIYDYDRFDPLKLVEKIEKYQITTFCAPPTIFRFLIKEDLSKYDFSSLSYITTAGEPLNPEVYKKVEKIFNLKLKEGFGQTETIISACNFLWMEPKPGSLGKPAPVYGMKLLTKENKEVDIGDEGEICLDAINSPPGLFKGYHKNEAKTKEVWYDGVYHSGDTAWKDEDGYLWFVGRNDDIIKSSGYRIGPFEVESAVISHSSVLECAITGIPDEIRGQIVKATIVLAKGFKPSEELKKDIQNHVKHVTAPYKYPRVVKFVDKLPKTINGKISRAQIRKDDKNKN